MIEILPLLGIAEIRAGDDLAGVLAAALTRETLSLMSRDVLVVTQKVVSKAEGRSVNLADMRPGAAAIELAAATGKDPRYVELVLSQSVAVVRAAPGVLITRHRLGFVMANAGVDRSNNGGADRPVDSVSDEASDGDCALLLPIDPDASAQGIALGLNATHGTAPAVVISDSFGRPWRRGVTNVAIGAWGLPSLVDRRGALDRDGRRLEMTEIALADQIASAAGMVMGEAAEGIPAALVRGCVWEAPASPASALVRPEREDLFR